jgi:hypothetical protein
VLGRDVVTGAGHGEDAGSGRGVHDRATTRAQHGRDLVLHAAERAEQVHLDIASHLVEREVRERGDRGSGTAVAERGDSRVVERAIEPAVLPHRPGHQIGDRRVVGDVDAHEPCSSAGVGDAADDVLAARRVDIDDRDQRAATTRQYGRRGSDARPGPGDQNGLSLE